MVLMPSKPVLPVIKTVEDFIIVYFLVGDLIIINKPLNTVVGVPYEEVYQWLV
jgi:hypothetical protein